jgi:hypothetical protein
VESKAKKYAKKLFHKIIILYGEFSIPAGQAIREYHHYLYGVSAGHVLVKGQSRLFLIPILLLARR